MILQLGNLTVREFAARVEAEFTDKEIIFLETRRCALAAFTDPEGFHIYDTPGISVHIGRDHQAVTTVFTEANARRKFNREINFYPQKGAGW